ncbi:hypothetical protein [Desulfovibrio sp. DV]|uniref:hypothetical protein n=1 Tax=Desulfovibrio sp. DV TaxID=1844708 RepID=UPI001115202B|nr:hypothetical protein [Desulfovibrio sp. DV]
MSSPAFPGRNRSPTRRSAARPGLIAAATGGMFATAGATIRCMEGGGCCGCALLLGEKKICRNKQPATFDNTVKTFKLEMIQNCFFQVSVSSTEQIKPSFFPDRGTGSTFLFNKSVANEVHCRAARWKYYKWQAIQ